MRGFGRVGGVPEGVEERGAERGDAEAGAELADGVEQPGAGSGVFGGDFGEGELGDRPSRASRCRRMPR